VNELSLDDLHLHVTILESWGPVHSLLIQRGSPHSEPAPCNPRKTIANEQWPSN
jgi:hypothetical protein